MLWIYLTSAIQFIHSMAKKTCTSFISYAGKISSLSWKCSTNLHSSFVMFSWFFIKKFNCIWWRLATWVKYKLWFLVPTLDGFEINSVHIQLLVASYWQGLGMLVLVTHLSAFLWGSSLSSHLSHLLKGAIVQKFCWWSTCACHNRW